MYGDYYPHRNQLTESQIHTIERITDLEFALNQKATADETFEIIPLQMPSNEWAIRLVHRNPFGYALAYDGDVHVRPFMTGLHDVVVDFKQAGFKATLASRGEAYHGQAETAEALAHQFQTVFEILRDNMPRAPFHMELSATEVKAAQAQPVQAQAQATDPADMKDLFKVYADKDQRLHPETPRRSLWGAMAATLWGNKGDKPGFA